MSEPFIPPSEDLPPLGTLLKLTDITEQVQQELADEWRENPPEDDVKNLLDAQEK